MADAEDAFRRGASAEDGDARSSMVWSRDIAVGWVVAGWVAAFGLFVGVVELLGGPSRVDLGETLYPTIAAAHGHLSCLYPPVSPQVFNTHFDPGTFLSRRYYSSVEGTTVYVSPGMPLLGGLIAALFHLGGQTPFPALAHCSSAIPAMDRWLYASGATGAYTNLAYAGWIPLAAGVTSFARAAIGRRTTAMLWLPLILAVTPPVLRCVMIVFHAEDLVAIGLSFAGAAAALRGRWGWTGAALACGTLFQPMTILVAALMMAIAPGYHRRRLVVVGAATFGAIVLPLAFLSGWRVVTAAAFGSSRVTPGATSFDAAGGSLVAELHLHGIPLFVVARLLPLVAAGLMGAWARRRFGDDVLRADLIVALIGSAFVARVLFDQNYIGYYLAPVAVSLTVLEVVRGRVRSDVVVWIGLVSMLGTAIPFSFAARFTPWGAQDYRVLYLVAIVAFAVTCLVHLKKGSGRLYPLVSLVVAYYSYACVYGGLPGPIPRWILQILVVPAAFWLLLAPVRERACASRAPSRRTACGDVGPRGRCQALGSIDSVTNTRRQRP